jgi:hypothetical protein
VAIELSAKDAVIRQGEPILLRVQLLNRERATVSTTVLAPWDAVTLLIQGPDGQIIRQSSPAIFGYKSLVDTLIAPGGTFTLRWQGSEFNPISDWGYATAFAPGRYTIVAQRFRCCSGHIAHDGSYRIPLNAESNAVKIEVLK